MGGIYIHIPFCKQACSYCNFHFSTTLSRKADVVECIQKELVLRKDYLKGETVETIYFGGGTPSLLNKKELAAIFNSIHQNYKVDAAAEVTLEANPDDLNREKLKEIKQSPINRLSIGVQSFFDEDLRFMNRAHEAQEAIDSIKNAQDFGFEQLNMDLIFGSQTTTDQMWQANLKQFFDLDIPHLSAYSLSIEEKTALAHQLKSGKAKPLDEERNFRQYLMLQEAIQANGYEQYELSNYCKNENYSKHNTSYWFGKSYLGIGPSAHSFNGNSRQWNINNNLKYIQAIQKGESYFEKEDLSEINRYHEYLITALRTKWGIDFKIIRKFSEEINTHFFKQIERLPPFEVKVENQGLTVDSSHLFQSDGVVRELMIDK
ncbi:MAG: radical SAM family heme chaperone HemW [Vicingaceae bacterium]